MAAKPLPDAECLRNLLDYDPATGLLVWLWRPREMFPASLRGAQAWNIWNNRYAGWPALTAKSEDGYRVGTILDQCVLAHRVIWKWMTGIDPDHVDHLNGDTSDNRWTNLRNTNAAGNNRNRCRPKNNRSGAVGVRFRADQRKWVAFIQVERRCIHLGVFSARSDAVAARHRAEQEMGFSSDHGKRQSPDWSYSK